jgi:hypothetical protein
MSFSITGFLLGRVLAEREGVANQADLTRLALVGSLVPSPVMGALITQQLAQREAPASAVPVLTPQPAPQPNPQTVTAPSFVGMPLDQAVNEATAKGLYTAIASKQPLVVIEQQPAAGAAMKTGEKVALAVALATTVPDFTKRPFEEAQDLATKSFLKVARQEAFHETVEKGLVVSQDQEAGRLVAVQTLVILTVSKGKAQTNPDLVIRSAEASTRPSGGGRGAEAKAQPEGDVRAAEAHT